MDEKLYLIDLDCYARAEEKEKKKVKESHCFDFGLLPTKGLQNEFRSFIENRSRQCALATMIQERVLYQRFCRMVKDKHIRAESLQELEWEQWLLKIRSWLLEHGQKLTMQGINVYGKEKTVPSSLITYVRKAYQFTEAKEERDEIEKDIWKLENLDVAYKKNPIKNVQTLNFTAIIQDDLREETKKAVYEHLHHEAIATIIKELTAIRRLSRYLKETYPQIHSAEDLNRELLEEYLTYLATEAEGVNNYRMDLTRLRGLLETIGKLYGYPHLEILFLASDLPRQVQPKLKSYSDSELIRFNAALAELDEQMERLMVIHQMLGTRISDTLTLQTDCLYRQDGHPMIQIRQMKTTTFVKPISAELELLIEKAIEYSKKRYGDTVYIFVDEKNSKRPMQYNTVQNKVMDLIQKKDLRDDHGELFGFGTHMFRHVYGIRLTELHAIKVLVGKYEDANKEYQTQLLNAIKIPLMVYSGRIIQNYPLGLGIRAVIKTNQLVFEAASKSGSDVYNILSTGQLNGLSIALLLSIKNVYGDTKGLDILLIDDPLQTIDDISAISLADLLTQQGIGQIVLSTHEEAKAALLRYKFKHAGMSVREQNMQALYMKTVTEE